MPPVSPRLNARRLTPENLPQNSHVSGPDESLEELEAMGLSHLISSPSSKNRKSLAPFAAPGASIKALSEEKDSASQEEKPSMVSAAAAGSALSEIPRFYFPNGKPLGKAEERKRRHSVLVSNCKASTPNTLAETHPRV